jgi:hypothetical protein
MGKATVLSNLGEGRYSVALDTGAASAAALLAQLQADFAALETQITQATNAVANLNNQVQALNDAWAAELAAYAANPSANTAAMEKALVALRTKEDERDARQRELTTMILNRGELAKRINVIQDKNYSAAREIWCADFTPDASGEVATIEIPGEPQHVLMVPGGAAHTASDGQLLARELMTGPQAYFNAAVLPGWQKFKPTYRRGVITAINYENDTADVTLTDDRSTAWGLGSQGLGINQTSTLSAVPILYQDCNAEVFEVGDNCVIEFQGQDWSNPKLIGFLSNPKSCSVWYLVAYLQISSSTTGPINYRWQAEYDYKNQTIATDFVYTNNAGGQYSFAQIHTFSDGNDRIYVSFEEGGRIIKIQKAPDYLRIWQTSINDNVYAITAKKHNGTWWIFAVTRGTLNSTQDIEKVARLNFEDGSVSVLLQKTINKVLAPLALRFSKSQNGNQIVAPYEYFENFSGFTPIIRYTDKFSNSKSLNIAYNLYTFSDNTVSASYDNKDASSTFNAHFYFNNNVLQKYQYNNFYPAIGRTYPVNPQATLTDSISATDSESRISSASATFTANNYDTLTNDFFGSVNNTIKVFYDPNYNISIDNIVLLTYVSILYPLGDSFTRGASQTYTISYLYNNNLLTSYSKNNDFPLSSDGYLPSLTLYTVSTNKAGPYFSNNVAIAYLPNIYALSYYYLNTAGNFNGIQQSNNSKITKLFQDALTLDNREGQYIVSIGFSLEFNSIL